MLPIIQSMGPAQAGTALKGFEAQFSSGNMSGGAITLLTEMGVIARIPTKRHEARDGKLPAQAWRVRGPERRDRCRNEAPWRSSSRTWFRTCRGISPRNTARATRARTTRRSSNTKRSLRTQIASRLHGRNLHGGDAAQPDSSASEIRATVAKLGGADAQKSASTRRFAEQSGLCGLPRSRDRCRA